MPSSFRTVSSRPCSTSFLRGTEAEWRRLCLPLLCLLVLGGVGGCKKKSKEDAGAAAAAQPKAVTVELSSASQQDFPVHFTTIGQLASPASVKVTAQIGGVVEEVHFKEGDKVKEGDLLFSIDDRTYRATLDKAKAAVSKAESDVELAKSNVSRSKELAEQSFVSKQDFEALQQAVVTAQAELQEAQTDVEMAKIQLDYTRIDAPISGQTGMLSIQEGNLAELGSANYLTTIVQMDPLYVDFMIPASMGAQARKRRDTQEPSVEVTASESLESDADWKNGTLDFIDNQVDTSSGTLKLRGTLPNSEGALWPGQYVTVRLTLEVLKDAVVVPTTAIRARESGAFLYVVDAKNIASVRPVELGPRDGDRVAVTKGLKAGEKVIVAGQVGLRDGSLVKVADPAKDDQASGATGKESASTSTSGDSKDVGGDDAATGDDASKAKQSSAN